MRVREIITAASDVFGIPAHAIYGPSRERPILRARQAVYFAASERGWSYSHIGRVLALDHSTVRHGRNVAQDLRRYEPDFDARLQRLQEITAR